MRRLVFRTNIPRPPEEVWRFFVNPANLNLITPADMRFRITTPLPEEMYEGMLIGYKVSPFPLMRVQWLTEITRIKEGQGFIDEQRLGPYRIWHHEHHFRATEKGVEMTDILVYSLPFGYIGKLIDSLIVARRVHQIFSFRESRIREIFPENSK